MTCADQIRIASYQQLDDTSTAAVDSLAPLRIQTSLTEGVAMTTWYLPVIPRMSARLLLLGRFAGVYALKGKRSIIDQQRPV